MISKTMGIVLAAGTWALVGSYLVAALAERRVSLFFLRTLESARDAGVAERYLALVNQGGAPSASVHDNVQRLGVAELKRLHQIALQQAAFASAGRQA